MAIARSKQEPIRYILRDDRALPAEQQTVFILRTLSNAQVGAINGMAEFSVDGSTARIPVAQQRLATLKAGLVGWENFVDASGVAIQFLTDKGPRTIYGISCQNPPTDATLEQLQLEHYEELADAIRSANTLQPDDLGK